MSAEEIVRGIVAGINSSDLELLRTSIVRAAYVFERYRYGPGDDGWGWDKDIQDTPGFTADHCMLIRDALTKFISDCAKVAPQTVCSRFVTSSVWALGKLRDKNTAKFLTDVLAKQIHWGMSAISQTVVTLEDIGEPVYGKDDKNRVEFMAPNQLSLPKIVDEYLATKGRGCWWAGNGELEVPPPTAPVKTTRTKKALAEAKKRA